MEETEFRERVMILQRLMYGIALRMGISPSDAADALQETLVRLWRGREGIPEDDIELKRYCVASLRNECVSRLRSRRIMISIEDSSELIAGAAAADSNQDGAAVAGSAGKRGCGKIVYSAPGADMEVEYKDTLSKLEALISTLLRVSNPH